MLRGCHQSQGTGQHNQPLLVSNTISPLVCLGVTDLSVLAAFSEHAIIALLEPPTQSLGWTQMIVPPIGYSEVSPLI